MIDRGDAYRWWRTADGRSIMVADMTDSHLVNAINWIADNADSYTDRDLHMMVDEAMRRQPVLFAEGKAYPQLIGSRWKLVDPATGRGHIVPPPKEYLEAVKDNVAYQEMARNTQRKRKG